jgi:hypothetical protein
MEMRRVAELMLGWVDEEFANDEMVGLHDYSECWTNVTGRLLQYLLTSKEFLGRCLDMQKHRGRMHRLLRKWVIQLLIEDFLYSQPNQCLIEASMDEVSRVTGSTQMMLEELFAGHKGDSKSPR